MSTDDREALAAHLSVKEFKDGFTWPEHAEDDGYRGDGGYVRIAPLDIQARRREAADRILTLLQQRGFTRPSSSTPSRQEEDGRRPDGHGPCELDYAGNPLPVGETRDPQPAPDPTTGGEAPGRAAAWLERQIEAAHRDADNHPEGSGNRSFYRGQAIAYENALGLIEEGSR